MEARVPLAPETERSIERLAARLADERRFLLCAHPDPDGDAIGSLAGMAAALEGAGREVYAALPEDGPAPRTYREVPGVELLRPPGGAPDWPLMLALDVPAVSRMAEVAEVARRTALVIRIDHHPQGESMSEFDVVDEDAPATALLVWRLLLAMGIPIGPGTAEALWVGLVTDTGRFQYSNATSQAFDMARALTGAGVKPEKVFRYVYDNRRLAALRLEALVVERAQCRLDGRFVWAAISDEDLEDLGAAPEETEMLIDKLRSIEGAEVALFVKVRPDGLRGSLRSKGRVDVSEIARNLGGGGHREASGFPAEGSVEDLVDRVQDMVRQALGGRG